MDMADSVVVDSTLAVLEVGEAISKFGNFSSYEGFKPEELLYYNSLLVSAQFGYLVVAKHI